MSQPAVQFPFVARSSVFGPASLAPMMPIELEGTSKATSSALLDTGAAVNVLPYALGTQLGFAWDQQATSVQLTGNPASVEARVILATATVAQFPPVRLAFAWARIDSIPLILGQVNFFMEFDVCFFRSRSLFDVRPQR